MICYINNKTAIRKETNFKCSHCDVPVCPHKCYDIHRREESENN